MPELPDWLKNLLDIEKLGELPWGLWGTAAGIFVGLMIVLPLLNRIIANRARKLGERPGRDYADLVADLAEGTKWLFLLIESAFLASLVLGLSEKAFAVASSVAIITLLIQAAVWGAVAVKFYVKWYAERQMERDPSGVTMISALGVLAKVVIYSLVVLLILDNVGIDVTAMVAGLGIGGVAVALAAQNILGDLFASASIVLDKPFVLGDFIIVGDFLGSVEHIGMKTTRIRSLSGEQLVFSNNDLLQSRIRNYKRMLERRVVFAVGVTYQTPYEKVAAIPGMLREAVEAQSEIRFDRAHFKAFGDFSLNYEIVYYVLTPDYAIYMDIQQAINLAIHQRFEQEGIEFAYPTQTVFVEGAASQGAAEATA